MRLNPTISSEWNSVRFDLTTPARWLIVTIFPAVCSSIALIVVTVLTWQYLTSLDLKIRAPASLHFALWAYWLNLCYGDILSIIYFFRTGERRTGGTLT